MLRSTDHAVGGYCVRTSEDYAFVRFKRAHQRVWLLQFGGKTCLPKHAQTRAVFGQGGIA